MLGNQVAIGFAPVWTAEFVIFRIGSRMVRISLNTGNMVRILENITLHKLPGLVKYLNITLKRGITKENHLLLCFKTSSIP